MFFVALFFHFAGAEFEVAEVIGFQLAGANHLGEDGNGPTAILLEAFFAADFAGDFLAGNK